MSEEWSLQPDVVDEHLEAILIDLEKENKDPRQCVDVVKERLIAALEPPPTVSLSLQYVDVEFSEGHVVAKTFLFGTKHYEGTCSSTSCCLWRVARITHALPMSDSGWAGTSSSGWMTATKDGSASYIASNRGRIGRRGNLQLLFTSGGSRCGHVSTTFGDAKLDRCTDLEIFQYSGKSSLDTLVLVAHALTRPLAPT